jgi:hypothetical protein
MCTTSTFGRYRGRGERGPLLPLADDGLPTVPVDLRAEPERLEVRPAGLDRMARGSPLRRIKPGWPTRYGYLKMDIEGAEETVLRRPAAAATVAGFAGRR